MTDAIYLRISQDREGLELGVDRQRKDCRKLAKRGAREYCDNDISATSGRRRPQYEELMAAVERGEVDRVIVWSDTRLYRSRKDRYRVAELFRERGIVLVAVKSGTFDFGSASGRLVADMLGAWATHETDQMTERLEAWAKQRAELGLHHGGPAPFGFRREAGKLKAVRGEAAKVKQWYADLLAGRTLTGIARSAGTGRRQLQRRLANPTYAGLRIHKGREYPGAFPALVDVDTWRAAQVILSAPSRYEGRERWQRRHIGSGLYVCQRCGHGRAIGTDNASRGYLVYRCWPQRGGCGRRWRAEFVDAYVYELARAELGKGDLAALLPKNSPDLRKLGEEAAGIRKRLKTLGTEYVLLGLDKADVEETAARARQRLAEIEAALGNRDSDELAAELVACDDPVAYFEAAALPRQQAIVDRLMSVVLTAAPRGAAKAGTDPAVWYVRECVVADPKGARA